MKNGLLIFNVVLLVLVGVLFYLHFSDRKISNRVAAVQSSGTDSTGDVKNCRIAYFEMDSIENSFAMVKDIKSELGKKEDAITNELTRMEKEYRNKAANYQAQAQAGMNQTQSEMAQRDMMETQQRMQTRKQILDQEYQDLQMRKLKDVRTRIEAFLSDYNKGRNYSYIVSYEPGLFYLKDTTYDITSDVIKGLNEEYKSKKK